MRFPLSVPYLIATIPDFLWKQQIIVETTSYIDVSGKKETTKHPQFDYYWRAHEKFIYSSAKKLGSVLRVDPKELLGTLTLKFNTCLWSYVPGKGKKITSYFAEFLKEYVVQQFLRKDSELADLSYFNKHRKDTGKRNLLSKKKEFIIVESLNYDIRSFEFTEDYDWLQDIDEIYPDREKFWDYLTKSLTLTEKQVILNSRGKTPTEITQETGRSVSNVKSYKHRAIKKIKEVIKQDSKLGQLVYKEVSNNVVGVA